jgi:fucose 4-O-acetylase-like acetyltransferase
MINTAYNELPLKLLDYLCWWIYYFHMPLFFVLSGLVCAVGKERAFIEGFDNMAINKFKRLLIPYFTYGLFFMLPLKFFAGGYTVYNISEAVGAVLGFHSDEGHLWFLASLFAVYILFFPIYRLIVVKTESRFAPIGIAIVASVLLDKKLSFYYPLQRAVNSLPYFAAGFAFGNYYENAKKFFQKRIVLIASCIISAVFAGLTATSGEFQGFLIPVNVLCNGAWILCVSIRLSETKLLVSKVYQLIHREQMRIYLFHDPINYMILSAAFTAGFMTLPYSGYVLFFVRTIGVLAVSLMLSMGISMMRGRFRLYRGKNQ